MKKIISAICLSFIFTGLFVLTAARVNAQQPVSQLRVTKEAVTTNPEFISRLASSEYNPGLAKNLPDPSARLKSVQSLADQFCQSLSVNVSPVLNMQGCYLDITYTHTYTYDPVATNAFSLPHGIYIEVCPGAQIQSATVISGTWLSGLTPLVGTNSIYWVKSCAGSSSFSNIIPSGQSLTVRIKLVNGLCGGSCTGNVKELLGWAYPTNTQFWSCQQAYTFTNPPVNYSISSATSLCSGSSTSISLTPTPPPGAIVKWYRYIPAKCTDPCPSGPVSCPIGTPWTLAQSGGTTCNTNVLTQTTCYTAVIENGCAVAASNIHRIDVCQGPPAYTISSATATTIIDGVNHACASWSGSLCLGTNNPVCCTIVNSGWEKRYRTLVYSGSCKATWGNWTNWAQVPQSAGKNCINTGTLINGFACQVQYEFRASLSNACGVANPVFTIVIDNPPVAGTITAAPPVPLCYNKATKLTYTPGCGEIVEWEKQEELSPCTNTWATPVTENGSQGTCTWWTNNLKKTTRYRVKVKNGACTPVFSPWFTVNVKPKLTVTIASNQTILCSPNSVILNAQTSYGTPCNYPVTYQWFRDGLPVPGAAGFVYHPVSGGNYSVVATDVCGKASSNVITICDKPDVRIIGACCICKAETISLEAVTFWNSSNCQQTCSYHWNTGAVTQSISVTAPGTYTVIVTCGNCPPIIKTVTIQYCQ